MKEREVSAGNPWEQQPGEPDRWYGRFKVYLELGPLRSLKAAARAAGERSRDKPLSWGGRFSEMTQRWQWRQRANAWDAHQRELLAISERNMRLALRDRRVERMEGYLEAICEVLDAANMGAVDERQARAWLPQMRVFLRDLLVAERQEFERSDYSSEDPANTLVITADDLRAAQRAFEAQPHERKPDPPGCPAANPSYDYYAGGRTRFVCVGADAALMLDLAALRAVRAATGLKFRRLLDATQAKFAEALRRERGLGRPVELLHLALHASPEGVAFADGVADGNWLSERLFGVRIMLLASCRGDSVGDWLGVVPHVITLSEEITHEDAAVLTQHFWQGIGSGLEPGAALDAALQYCPPAVGELVVRHW